MQTTAKLLAVVVLTAATHATVWAAETSWVPNADGNWNVESNWSLDALPNNADNVTIDRPGDLTVTVDERAVSILGLTSEDNLSIVGQRFTVAGSANVNGALNLLNATLTASGAGASFTSSGDVTIADSAFSAAGGTISLPSFTGTTLANTSRTWAANSNGQIDFGSLTSITTSASGRLTVDAQSGGSINLGSLNLFNNTNGSRSGFNVIGADSSIQIDALTTANDLAFTTSGGGVLAATSLGSFSADAARAAWTAAGENSAIDMGNLATIQTSGAGSVVLNVQDSGSIDLRSLATFQNSNAGRSTFTVTGADSQLNLASLTSADDIAFSSLSGGKLNLPMLPTFAVQGLSAAWGAAGNGSELSFPSLSQITSSGAGRLTVTADSGGQIDLNALTAFSNTAGNRNTLVATGAGSQIKLDALSAANDLAFTVANGGSIRLPALVNLNDTIATTWDASGAGSTLAFPSLEAIGTTNTGRLTIQSQGGAAIDLSKLAAIDNPENARLSISSSGRTSSVDLSSLASARSVALTAASGSSLSLPALTDYTVEGTPVWTSTGIGSRLAFGSLTELTTTETGRVTVEAVGGGAVDLGKLTLFANPTFNNRITFAARGTNSHVDLGSLSSTASLGFTAESRGSIDLTKLAVAPNAAFTVAGELTQMTLPALTSYQSTQRTVAWSVSGFESHLGFPALTTMTASDSGRLSISAMGGANLDLSALTTIENPTNNAFSITASGLTTTANLSSLTTAPFVSFVVSDGATMDLGKLATPVNSSFGARNGSQLTLPSMTTFAVTEKFPVWDSSGSRGRLSFPALTGISVSDTGSFSLQTQSGGELDLSNLTTIEHTNTRTVSVTSSGAGAMIKMPALTTAPFVAFGANQRGSMDLSSLTSTTDSSFAVGSRGTLTLGALTEFSVTTKTANWTASDQGSELSFPNLTKISLPDRGGVNLGVTNGGKLDLSALTTIENPNLNPVSMTAIGPGSQIDASSLSLFAGTTIEARGGGTIELSDATTTVRGANLRVHATGTFNAGTIQLEAGSQIRGDGVLNANVVNTEGIVSSGFSPGILTIAGTYEQSSDAAMDLELLGPTLGAEYDHLVIDGLANVAGGLRLFVSGYEPELGTLFHLINAPSGITGSFETITTSGTQLGLAPIYETNRFLVRASLKGDTNLDGQVSFGDFLALSGNFGLSGSWSEGDYDGDGMTGFPDFLALSGNFGRSESAAVASVPEPSACWLFVMGTLALLRLQHSAGLLKKNRVFAVNRPVA